MNPTNRKIFLINIEKETLENTLFRKILFTSKHQQLVAMNLTPKQDIPREIHKEHDQFIRIEKGNGIALIGENGEESYDLSDGVSITIPANTWHQIINTSNDADLKLYTIYSPPEHNPLTASTTRGGYQSKYMKYKLKYLELKNRIH
jgi:mannose-6-phosphate isomerase-like protein (cupin superfamily)